MAMAAGTNGHRMFTAADTLLEERMQMERNLSGLKPRRPLSPSASMPGVTLSPLWLTAPLFLLKNGSPPPCLLREPFFSVYPLAVLVPLVCSWCSREWRAIFCLILGRCRWYQMCWKRFRS